MKNIFNLVFISLLLGSCLKNPNLVNTGDSIVIGDKENLNISYTENDVDGDGMIDYELIYSSIPDSLFQDTTTGYSYYRDAYTISEVLIHDQNFEIAIFTDVRKDYYFNSVNQIPGGSYYYIHDDTGISSDSSDVFLGGQTISYYYSTSNKNYYEIEKFDEGVTIDHSLDFHGESFIRNKSTYSTNNSYNTGDTLKEFTVGYLNHIPIIREGDYIVFRKKIDGEWKLGWHEWNESFLRYYIQK